MDALVPAFVAALLAGIGDRPARIAALLAVRGRVATIIAGMILGHTLAIAIAIGGAVVIAPLMATNARSLLLAIALILAGFGTIWHRKALDTGGGNVFIVATAGAFVAGDGTAFLAFALAVTGSAPALAGVGALAGATMLAAVAATMARDWTRLPLALLGRIAGAVLLLTGSIVALGALRLI